MENSEEHIFASFIKLFALHKHTCENNKGFLKSSHDGRIHKWFIARWKNVHKNSVFGAGIPFYKCLYV